MQIVEVFPFGQFGIQVHIIRISEELVKFGIVVPVRALHFAIEPGWARLNVNVTKAEILQMPMKARLELVSLSVRIVSIRNGKRLSTQSTKRMAVYWKRRTGLPSRA